jgi:hypothetical protein
MRRSKAAVLAAAPLLLLTIADADAQRGDRNDRGGGSVRACSRYANGCVTGAVRPGQFDRQVRMPGGTWIDCKQDCRETLREETVDFFETLRERSRDQR